MESLAVHTQRHRAAMAPEDVESDEMQNEAEEGAEEQEEREPLKLEVQIASPGACQRHVTVTVPRDRAMGRLRRRPHDRARLRK